MNKFEQLTKDAFENYHNMPYESGDWSFTTALGHIMQFLEHHDSIDEMSGLRDALEAMTAKDWENWYERYPEARSTVIEPLFHKVARFPTN